jgi:hypothetical protein
VIKWGADGNAWCSGCGQRIVRTTCRKCKSQFSF